MQTLYFYTFIYLSVGGKVFLGCLFSTFRIFGFFPPDSWGKESLLSCWSRVTKRYLVCRENELKISAVCCLHREDYVNVHLFLWSLEHPVGTIAFLPELILLLMFKVSVPLPTAQRDASQQSFISEWSETWLPTGKSDGANVILLGRCTCQSHPLSLPPHWALKLVDWNNLMQGKEFTHALSWSSLPHFQSWIKLWLHKMSWSQILIWLFS